MKLSDHVEYIRQLIDMAFRNRLGRMGITASTLQPIDAIPKEYRTDRQRIDTIREVLIAETGNVTDAFEKLVEEFTFTLFNRMAALKVMEAHTLHPEIVTRRIMHGNRSFAHKHWLEQNADGRNEEMEGLVHFIEDQLESLSSDIPLFSPHHPYHLLPTTIELNSIISAFNQVETDEQVDTDIWKSDDVLGWLYESYNNYKKAAHKESGAKTEYNKVSIQSQVYTPRWVVKFLVDNSLGKLYLEMYPDSNIKNSYKIAFALSGAEGNATKTPTRTPKPLTEIRLIDPATGSGNFLLYAFDLFYDLYTDQIENYGADYDDRKIAELIIAHNLHGIDLDDRAIQLAQLGLYIKAKRKKRSAKIEHFNVVSSDFFLPAYPEVKHLFESGQRLSPELEKIVIDLWADLQQAYKFGSLIRLEEKFSMRLHGLVEKETGNLFSESTLASYEIFRDSFFTNLQKAVAQNTFKQGKTFLNTKTQDAITFLQLLTQKYDLAVANPPYTDSSNFGPQLKKFIDENYKKYYKFNTNLYASFIKRCIELTEETGYVALIHPHTFMFIQSFEDVRKYLIENTHIDIFVDFGLDRVNLFGPGVLLDATWYVLSKQKNDSDGVYFNITSNQQEKTKQLSLEIAYDDLIANKKNDRVYKLKQSNLKIIDGWPLIYWISDSFRDKFKGKQLHSYLKAKKGLGTENNRFFRFWWEINKNDISEDYIIDKKKWVGYVKGGPFKKWYGNLWLVINWKNNGEEIKSLPSLNLRNPDTYLKEGIACSLLSSKGTSFRFQPQNYIYDSTTRSIFLENDSKYSLKMYLALLNSNVASYILNCLNATVATNSDDIHRIPMIEINKNDEAIISNICTKCIEIKMNLNQYSLIEKDYLKSPLLAFNEPALKNRLLSFLSYENTQNTNLLLNEAFINQQIINLYDLSSEDIMQVEAKLGKSVGDLPVLDEARRAFLNEMLINQDVIQNHINNLVSIDFDSQHIQSLKMQFNSLYQSNNDLEEFCICHNINPINIWYWFKESNILPQGRVSEILLEFLADALRTILMEDEDGIIPLVGLPGEPKLMDRLEQHCLKEGFSSAQFMQLDGLLGRAVNEYIEHHFFKNFSDHLNLFMYLPKTPFIWHLSSGEYQAFEAYIIIYKWNRDSLYKLKSSYLSKRTESLQYRLQHIADSTSAQAQTEKETIRLQLQEIDTFAKKVDELIAEGYDPKLDDGVGKNIAPLQKKGMLRAEVLNKKQLEKYLNADW